jgi:GNAT superfamily N-acetyltransferase
MLFGLDSDGEVVAYGDVFRMPWFQAGQFDIAVCSDPACRGRGIASGLLASLESFARENGGKRLHASVRDHMPACHDWATRRGYEPERHLFESVLHLNSFDGARFAPVLNDVQASGIRFFTLAEQPGETTERDAYAVYAAFRYDIPGWSDRPTPTFEQWRETNGMVKHPELTIFAADGDRIVGMTMMRANPDTGGVYTWMTGVDAAYRGRQIALALKLRGIAAARAIGASYMRTNNDSENAAMLSINRKLGYVPEPGYYLMVKVLG